MYLYIQLLVPYLYIYMYTHSFLIVYMIWVRDKYVMEDEEERG